MSHHRKRRVPADHHFDGALTKIFAFFIVVAAIAGLMSNLRY